MEEQGQLTTSLNHVRSQANELILTLNELERQSLTSKDQWVSISEKAARQFHTLSEKIAPTLDHWVFLPKRATDRLPDLLLTKLNVEQEKRETVLALEAGSAIQDPEQDVFQRKQYEANESVFRLMDATAKSKEVLQIQKRKRLRMSSTTTTPATTTTTTTTTMNDTTATKTKVSPADGAALFRLLYTNKKSKTIQVKEQAWNSIL